MESVSCDTKYYLSGRTHEDTYAVIPLDTLTYITQQVVCHTQKCLEANSEASRQIFCLKEFFCG